MSEVWERMVFDDNDDDDDDDDDDNDEAQDDDDMFAMCCAVRHSCDPAKTPIPALTLYNYVFND
jgi:hypothetical protein